MTTTFPTTKDTFTNPTATDDVSVVVHSAQHANINDAMAAVQTKLGVDNSAVTTSIDYKLKNTASVDPGHKHSVGALTSNTGIDTFLYNMSVGFGLPYMTTGVPYSDVTWACYDGFLGQGAYMDGDYLYNIAANAAPLNKNIVLTTSNLSLIAPPYGTILTNATSGNKSHSLDAASYYPSQVFVFKKTDATANTVTISRSAGGTIDGAASYVLTTQWQFVAMQSDGTNWYIIAKG